MKKILVILLLLLLLTKLSFAIQAQKFLTIEGDDTLTFEFGKVEPKKSTPQQLQNIETIYYGNNTQLTWDSNIDDFVIDEYFVNNKYDDDKLEVVLNSIQNKEWVYLPTKLKYNELTKGDIAFLYILNLKHIGASSCLKMHFDVLSESKKYADGLLDYLENNRIDVQNKMRVCLNNNGYLKSKMYAMLNSLPSFTD